MHTALHNPTQTIISAEEAHERFHRGQPSFQNKTDYECPFCGVPVMLIKAAVPLEELKYQRPYFSARHVGEHKHDEDCEALLLRLVHPQASNRAQAGKVFFETQQPGKDKTFGKKEGGRSQGWAPQFMDSASKGRPVTRSPHCSIFSILQKDNGCIEKLRQIQNLWVRDRGEEIPFKEYVRPASDFDPTRSKGMIYGLATLEHQPDKQAIRFRFKERGTLRKAIMSSYRYKEEDANDPEFNAILNDLPNQNIYEIAFLWWKCEELDKVFWLECDKTEVWLK